MINYQNIPAFVEWIDNNKFPNQEIILQIERHYFQTIIAINIFTPPFNVRQKRVVIELFAPTKNGKWVDDSLPIDKNQYQIMIKRLKAIYENQGLEIDYLLIGNFIIELNKVFPIESNNLHELLEV